MEEARAQLGITRADQYPFLDAQAQLTSNRPLIDRLEPGHSGRAQSLDATYTQAGGALSWELDLWGRLRRLTEAARAQYLATEEARRGVVGLAGLRRDGHLLHGCSSRIWNSRSPQDARHRQETCDLVQLRHDRGAASGLDVHQAEQFLYTATAQIAAGERDIAQTENALSLLLGKPPAAQRARQARGRFRIARRRSAGTALGAARSAGPISARPRTC